MFLFLYNLLYLIIQWCFCLFDQALVPDDDQELTWSRARLILSRLAVVVGVLLLVAVLIVIRLFVHIDSNTTRPSSVDYCSMYPNVTLTTCNDTVTARRAPPPPTIWAPFVDVLISE